MRFAIFSALLPALALAGMLASIGCVSDASVDAGELAEGGGDGTVLEAGEGGAGGGAGAEEGGSTSGAGAAAPGEGSGEGGAEPAPFLDGFFPIAADYQHSDLFERWKARGVNTMIRVPPKDDVSAWTKKANELGLRMIREPRADPKNDVGEENLLAWSFRDEPELHGVPASELASFRKKLHAVDPTRPILVNFWGGGMLQNPDGCYGKHCYEDYVEHADWLSSDIYPCNKYGCDITLVGKTVSRLRKWKGPGQEVFTYIETSDWDGNGSGPSPRRFRAEVWDAIIHGARGVFYFCVRLKSGCTPGSGCLAEYDATPKEIADTMKPLHELLTSLGPVLQGRVNPKAFSMKVDAPLEVGWRKGPDGAAYFFVLNTSDSPKKGQKLRIEGLDAAGPAKVVGEGREVEIEDGATLVDDFVPYATHIYRIE